jgi:RND family efflux transporter MFP subunit
MKSIFPGRSIASLLGCFLIAAISLGCGSPQTKEVTPPAPVKAEKGTMQSFGEWIGLLGVTQPLPNMSARVTAPIEGRVLWVLGDGTTPAAIEGQRVEKDQIVVKLDDRVARANRDTAAAAAEDLKEQEKQADYAMEVAKIDVERLEKLKPNVSPIEIEKAHIALKDAESKKRGAVARQEQNRAEVKALDEQLALFAIRAPLAGKLGMIQVVPGQTLAVGAPITDVVYLDEVDVLCYVSPNMLTQLRRGQTAHPKDDDDEDAEGRVEFIAPVAQADTGNFAVKVRLPNRGLRFRANMVVRVEVQTEAATERFTIPASALMEDQDPPAVIVVMDAKTTKDADGKEQTIGVARKLFAEVGVRGGEEEHPVVEIRGLKDDKQKPVEFRELVFVTEGGRGLEDGEPVKVEKEEPKEGETKKEK